jgi:hypothetical protein
MKTPCAFKTNDRFCGLRGCVTDSMGCTCAEQRLSACYHFYCPFHYARLKEKLKPDEERAFFDEWCKGGRWVICQENPGVLWQILCGLRPAHGSLAGAWESVSDKQKREELENYPINPLFANMRAVKRLADDLGWPL